MLKVVSGFLTSSYGKIAGIVTGAFALMLTGWFIFRNPKPLNKSKKISPNWTQERVRLNNDLNFSDEEGNRSEEEKPENTEDVEQTVTIEDSTGRTRRLFVERTESWFPEITGSPSVSIRGLSQADVKGVTVVNQSISLFGFDSDAVMLGPSYSIRNNVGLSLSYTPLRIWAFRFGPGIRLTTAGDLSGEICGNVKIRENLHLNVGITPVKELGTQQVTVGLLYNF